MGKSLGPYMEVIGAIYGEVIFLSVSLYEIEILLELLFYTIGYMGIKSANLAPDVTTVMLVTLRCW